MSGWQSGAPVAGWQQGKPIQPPNGLVDALMSAGSGLVQGASHMLMMAPGVGTIAPLASAAASAVEGGLGVLPKDEAARRVAQGVYAALRPMASPESPLTSNARANAALDHVTGADYTPQTRGGRYVKAVAQNVPNLAAGPEGLLPRVASVVLPGVLGEGAADATDALGGDQRAQDTARIVGGVLGGVGAGATAGLAKVPGILGAAEVPAAKAMQSAINLGGSADGVRDAVMAGRLPFTATPGLTQLGETVATLPGEGQAAIHAAVNARRATQTERALQAVSDHLGIDPATAHGDIDALAANGRKSVGPAYTDMEASTAPVWNADLAQLSQRPAIKKAIGVVANDMLNAGQHPTTAGFALDPDTGWSIPSSEGSLNAALEQQPTAATWIKVHQALGRTVDRHPITGRPLPDSESPGNFGVNTAGRDLKTALAGNGETPGAIPGYADVLDKAGDYLSTGNAFSRAKGKLFGGSVYDFGKLWTSLGSGAEQNAARSAMANDIMEASDKGRFEPGLFKSPGVQAKLKAAFGDQAAPFIDQMEADTNERNAFNQVTGNSRTASRQALVAQMAKDNPKTGVAGVASKALGAAEWLQTLAHPTLLATKLAHGALDSATGVGKTVTQPWDDPRTNAFLGQILTDPAAMSAFLDRMGVSQTAKAAARASARQGLLALPLAGGAVAAQQGALREPAP